MITFDQLVELMNDRPRKLLPEQVGYGPAPEGSAIRCGGCFHMYRRVIDNYGVCELVRPENDEEIQPHFRCGLFSVEGDVMPLMPERNLPSENESNSDRARAE